MDPVVWDWIAVIVAVAGIAPAVSRRLAPVRGIAPALVAMTLAAILLAAAGGLVVDGWWPASAIAACAGALVVGVAAAGTAARTATGFGDHLGPLLLRFAAVTDTAVVAVGLLALALAHLVIVEWVGSAHPALVLTAFGAGLAAAAGALAVFDVGRPVEAPRRGVVGTLLAPVVLAPIAVAAIGAADSAREWSSLPIAVLTVGVVATILAAAVVRHGDPASVVRRRGYLVSGIVGASGFVLVWTERSVVGAGGAHVLGLGSAVLVGAALSAGLGWVGHLFTSDHWRPAARIAARSRSGAAAVIVAGIGDAARAGAVVMGLLTAGMFAAHRAGEYAGAGGGVGFARGGAGRSATVGGAASGLRFATLGRAMRLPDDAPDTVRESVEATVAAGSAARAVGAVVVVSAGSLTALGLVVALWEVSVAGIIGGGIGMVIGVAAGVAAVWYTAGWALHTAPDTAPPPRGTPPRAPAMWAVIGVLVATVAVAVAVPVSFGHARAAALGGYLVGMLAVGPALAAVLVVAGGAWENVRRLIETGAYGGVGSRAHRAVVAADTIGESLRVTAVTTVVALLVTTAAVALAFATSF